MLYPLPLSTPRAIRLFRTLSASPTRAPHPFSSHVLKSSTQVRTLGGCSHQRYGNVDAHARIRITRYQRLSQSRLGGTPAVHPRQAPAPAVWGHQHHYRRRPWWTTRWDGTRSKPSTPGSTQNAAHPQMSFWEAESARMQQRMEQIRKEIATDPYTALFGRRLQSLGFPSNMENRIMSACRSVFGMGKADEIDRTTHVAQDRNVQDLEYDPIRGRMVPRKSSKHTAETRGGGSPDTVVGNHTQHETRTGYLSAVDRVKEHANDGASTLQDSESAKETQADPSCMLGQAGTSSDGATLSESHRHQDSLERPTSEVESRGNGMKEQLNSDHGAQANGLESQTWSRFPAFNPDHYKPTSFAVGGPAQQPEPRLREERAEDLDLLRASDIRSLYNAKSLKGDPEARHKTRKDLDTAFDSYIDPLSDVKAEDVRARFQEPVPASSVNGATRSGPSMLESTAQLQSVEGSSNNSGLPVQEEHTDASFPGKQARKSTQATAGSSLIGDTYRVLAYDPSTLQITRAESNSSFHTTHEFLHPSEILPRLNNPSKFLPYFEEMQIDGYEIVSGGGDILVFKKALAENAENVKRELGAYVRDEPLFSDEVSRRPNTANTASPASGSSCSETNVPPRKSRSRIGTILRRMLIGGFATAATCYALGVVSEYFRTGGQDGRGIDGFTEFESERRHRDRE
ncbi:conserved serine-threonine rich protein [Aspergillus bombycis]|uniref:Conserved serine-threonine rich protein n=1 Tax=Aspergillus bombycis TaxID=109264 RepID=A0A1F7ZNC9_9EURO|nr:conserved serine-threonine rich protein [Aspergillus bombycis]OGM40967.1 conserved serine-threonine rich protein [Aspergillus bombycis]